jgi:hypothetical protein
VPLLPHAQGEDDAHDSRASRQNENPARHGTRNPSRERKSRHLVYGRDSSGISDCCHSHSLLSDVSPDLSFSNNTVLSNFRAGPEMAAPAAVTAGGAEEHGCGQLQTAGFPQLAATTATSPDGHRLRTPSEATDRLAWQTA